VELVGQDLRHYRIEAKLGAGGMGVVYRARDTHLDRFVAIKVLPAAMMVNSERRTRFVQEAKAASALSHPNIITIHDIDTAEFEGHSVDYIAMEYVQGKTLDQLIGRKGLRLTDVLKYASQVAGALAAAHAVGIVHRDLKPGNIMVTEQGAVKLLDFGLAKLTEPLEADVFAATESVKLDIAPQTEEGTIIGTVAYMSPEQAECHRVDQRSDIFSFGAVVYEMVTGRRAFSGDSKLSTLASILPKDPVPTGEQADRMPRELESIIARCLRKSPERRWQSMADVKIALDDLQDQIDSGKLEGAASAAAGPSTTARVFRWLWPALVLLALATGVYAGSRLFKTHPPSFERLSFRRGDVNSAKFASDGQTIVFSAQWDRDPSRIFSTRIGSRESSALNLPDARLLSISSSGEMAVLLGGSAPGTLARVPLAGGAPREILDNVRDADWAPSGDNLAIVRAVGRNYRIEFPIGHVLYESHGRPAQGSDVPPDSLRVSPKGNAIAFFNYDAEAGDFSVMMVDLHGHVRVLSRGWIAMEGLGWSPKGDEIWFGGARPGEDPALRAVSLDGAERVLMQSPVFVVLYDVARDGRVLVVSSNSRIGIAYMAPDAKEERDLSWLDTSRIFEISPDGKTILFNELSYGTGRNPAIYLRKTDGSPAVRLGDGAHPSLSPDGKWVLCKRKDAGKSELVILPTGAGDVRSLTTPGMDYESVEWFPDGKQVLFTGNEPGHSFRTYMQQVNGGKPVPVTAEGKSAARVSPDQTNAVIIASNKLSLQPLSGGESRAVADVEPGDSVLRWSEDGKFLYLLRREGAGSASIQRLNIASGKIELWRQLRQPDPVGVSFFSASITPDGRSYAYSFQRELTNLYLGTGLK